MERVRLCLERKLLYKKILYLLLVLGILALSGSLYYAMWSSVPSTIMLKADMDQELNLKVPASGELYREAVEVSGGNGNIRTQHIYVNLGKKVTVKTGHVDQYKMNLKLFGVIPLKEVDVQVIQDKKLQPAGIPIGIYVKTKGVLVVGSGEFEGEDGRK